MFGIALIGTLLIEKGTTFDQILRCQSGEPPSTLNLTGCEALLNIRPAFGSVTLLDTYSTANGKLVIDGAAGKITFNVSDEQTDLYTWDEGVFALYVDFPNGTRRCFMRGPAYVEVGTT